MYYDYAAAQERSLAFADQWRGSEPMEVPEPPCARRFDICDAECAACSGYPTEFCCRYDPEV